MDATKKRKLEENTTATTTNGTVATALTETVITAQLTSEDARKIIEPFTREQLVDILQSAVTRHVDVLSAVRSIADRDQGQRKLFVRGLGWETTSEKLRSVFGGFGELDEAAVILDKATGKSKGFAFVTYRHVDGAVLALKEPSKKIDGRMTVSQLANANTTPGANVSVAPVISMADISRKIYVGNVPYEMTGERLLAHFLSYGEIEEGPLGYDKATGKSKGYALFVYKTAEAARAALVDPIKTIDGAQLNCKIANPSDGKKGKPTGPGGAPVDAPPQMLPGGGYGAPGQLAGPGQYGPPGGYSQGPPPPMGHNNHMNHQPPPSSLGGYGPGGNGPYGGSHYGGPGSGGGYSGYGPGGGGGGLGGLGGGGGLGGLGGSGALGGGMGVGGGMASSGGGRGGYGMPPGSGGGYNESAHYSLSSSGYGGQHHQPAGTSPGPRGPHGMYHGGPPFY